MGGQSVSRRRLHIQCSIWALFLVFFVYYYPLQYTETDNDSISEKKQTKKVTLSLSDDESGPTNSASRLKIVHVVSPFIVDNCEDPFCPFDQAQSVTLASMQRARTSAKRASVLLAASVFPEFAHVVPSDFLTLDTLNRSTASEYPDLILRKKLPFIGDILQSLQTIDRSFFDYNYVVYTNTDILLRGDFYDLVAKVIENEKLDAFSINRQTVPKNSTTGRLFTSSDLDEIFTLESETHPGHDCFILKRSILEQMEFGDVFVGFPGVGNILRSQADVLSNGFQTFGSHELNATYHLGNDRGWLDTSDEIFAYHQKNVQNLYDSISHLWEHQLDHRYLKLMMLLQRDQKKSKNRKRTNDQIKQRQSIKKKRKYFGTQQQSLDSSEFRRVWNDRENDTSSDDESAVSGNKSPGSGGKPIVLKPPFRILQVGTPRSGSTFQFQLLQAMAHLKSPEDMDIRISQMKPSDWNDEEFLDKIVRNESFVLKLHFEPEVLQPLQDAGEVAIFSSGEKAQSSAYSHYHQNRKELVKCSSCEIDRYRTIFNLTDDDVVLLKDHMSLYEKIRKCCGLQMSKYQMLRLHGCDVSKFTRKPNYPHCETQDMADVEHRFRKSPIPYVVSNPEYNWAQPGDCARFDAEIVSGKDFNGTPFSGCKSGRYRHVGRRANL